MPRDRGRPGVVDGCQPGCTRPPVAGTHLDGVEAVRTRALLQGGRDEPGDRTPGVLLAGAGGQGLPPRAPHRHPPRVLAWALSAISSIIRPDHSVPAADLAAGLAAA